MPCTSGLALKEATTASTSACKHVVCVSLNMSLQMDGAMKKKERYTSYELGCEHVSSATHTAHLPKHKLSILEHGTEEHSPSKQQISGILCYCSSSARSVMLDN